MKYLIVILFLSALISPLAVRANVAVDQLKDVGSTKGPYLDASEFGLSNVIGTVVQGALGLIGAIFLILMLYAGYNWMTARGEEEKVEKAKETLTRAIIGILIVVGAYAIWAYIASSLFKNEI